MPHLSSISKELPADGLKHKRARKSPCLQERYKQKGQVDNLLTDSQLIESTDPTEPLDVALATSLAQSGVLGWAKNVARFNSN